MTKLKKAEAKIEQVASIGKGILRTAHKAARLAKGAKNIVSRVKAAAGESKCANKKCSWTEKIKDVGERLIKGGHAAYGEKEKIQHMIRQGKELASGKELMKEEKKKKSSAPIKKKMKKEKPMKKEKKEQVPKAPAAPPAPKMEEKKAQVSNAPERSKLLEDIRKGKALKKVEAKSSKSSSESDVEKELKKQMAARRKFIRD
jgi:hypothetical protein